MVKVRVVSSNKAPRIKQLELDQTSFLGVTSFWAKLLLLFPDENPFNTQKKITFDEFQECSKIIELKADKYEISDLQGR